MPAPIGMMIKAPPPGILGGEETPVWSAPPPPPGAEGDDDSTSGKHPPPAVAMASRPPLGGIIVKAPPPPLQGGLTPELRSPPVRAAIVQTVQLGFTTPLGGKATYKACPVQVMLKPSHPAVPVAPHEAIPVPSSGDEELESESPPSPPPGPRSSSCFPSGPASISPGSGERA